MADAKTDALTPHTATTAGVSKQVRRRAIMPDWCPRCPITKPQFVNMMKTGLSITFLLNFV